VDRVDAERVCGVERLHLEVRIAEQAVVLENRFLPRACVSGCRSRQQQYRRRQREQRFAHELASGGAEGHYFLPNRVRFGFSVGTLLTLSSCAARAFV